MLCSLSACEVGVTVQDGPEQTVAYERDDDDFAAAAYMHRAEIVIFVTSVFLTICQENVRERDNDQISEECKA